MPNQTVITREQIERDGPPALQRVMNHQSPGYDEIFRYVFSLPIWLAEKIWDVVEMVNKNANR